MSESKVPSNQDPRDASPGGQPAVDGLGMEIPVEGGSDSLDVRAETNNVTRLEVELQQAQEQLMRSQADLENYRRRVRRDTAEQRKYAQLPLLQDLLPVLDNFDLALGALEPNETTAGVLQGVKMVAGQLLSVFQQHHCERIDAAGEPFDPNLHEAIAQEPCNDQSPGIVIRVAKAGYRLHDRVIRPAQVVVSASAAGPAESHDASDPDQPADAHSKPMQEPG